MFTSRGWGAQAHGDIKSQTLIDCVRFDYLLSLWRLKCAALGCPSGPGEFDFLLTPPKQTTGFSLKIKCCRFHTDLTHTYTFLFVYCLSLCSVVVYGYLVWLGIGTELSMHFRNIIPHTECRMQFISYLFPYISVHGFASHCISSESGKRQLVKLVAENFGSLTESILWRRTKT